MRQFYKTKCQLAIRWISSPPCIIILWSFVRQLVWELSESTRDERKSSASTRGSSEPTRGPLLSCGRCWYDVAALSASLLLGTSTLGTFRLLFVVGEAPDCRMNQRCSDIAAVLAAVVSASCWRRELFPVAVVSENCRSPHNAQFRELSPYCSVHPIVSFLLFSG